MASLLLVTGNWRQVVERAEAPRGTEEVSQFFDTSLTPSSSQLPYFSILLTPDSDAVTPEEGFIYQNKL